MSGASPRFASLDEWLAWQETLHPTEIDLGLERVAAVAADLDLLKPSCPVITVAGTNGKGSCVALLDAVLRAAGCRTGVYTSPHLLAYNERIRVNGRPATDGQLCAAFERIDRVRGERSLTYFEFGTLAALEIFRGAAPDVMVLEVGLGGRLDAVNIIDPDVALVTSIDLDHTAWLGEDREAIGREKAGIFRAGRPAVCGDPSPPASLFASAQGLNARWHARGNSFTVECGDGDWTWRSTERALEHLPLPALSGAHQLDNAAAVLQVLDCLRDTLPVGRDAIESGLRSVRLAGRFERIPGPVERVLDVAHNPQGGRTLARALADAPVSGDTHLVLGMLADKDVKAFVAPLLPLVNTWYPGGLAVPRGLGLDALRERLRDTITQERLGEGGDTVLDAYHHAMAAAHPGDRVVVCGSFYSVAEVAAELDAQSARQP